MQFLFSNKLSDASLSRTLADTGRLPLSPHRGEAGGKQKRPQVVACDPSKTKGETRATNAYLEYHRLGGSPRECWGGVRRGCQSYGWSDWLEVVKRLPFAAQGKQE